MTYANNLEKTNQFSGFMIKVSPRIWLKQDDFASFSGSVYRIRNWTRPRPRALQYNATVMTEVFTTSLSAGQWYYDEENLDLYVRTPNSGNLTATTYWLMCTIEIFHSTFEKVWHRDPTDDSTETIFWEGDLLSAPEVSMSAMQVKYGFVNVDASGFEVANKQNIISEVLHKGSYKQAEIKVWHCLGDHREDSNYQLIFTGAVDGSVTVGYDTTSFEIVNKNDLLNGNILSKSVRSADYQFGLSTFAVGENGGLWSGIKPQNIDFEPDATPSTSNSRRHAMFYGLDNSGSQAYLNAVVVSYTSASFGNFILNMSSADANKFQVGDFVQVDPTGADSYGYVVAVNANSIEVDVAASGSGAGFVRKYAANRVYLVQNNTRYDLMPGRDYGVEYETTGDFTGMLSLVLTPFAESNVGASTIDPYADTIIVALKPMPNTQTFGGNALQSSYPTGVSPYKNIYHLMYFYLKQICGISESFIDGQVFIDLWNDFGDEIGTNNVFPGRDIFNATLDKVTILNKFLEIAECFGFYDSDGKITIKKASALDSPLVTIDLDELDRSSWQYLIDYRDVKNKETIVEGGLYSAQMSKADILAGTTPAPAVVSSGVGGSYFTDYGIVLYLHKESGFTSADKQRLNRVGLITTKVPFKLSNRNIGDTVRVRSQKLVGENFSQSSLVERDFIIREIKWSIQGTSVILEDLYDADTFGIGA